MSERLFQHFGQIARKNVYNLGEHLQLISGYSGITDTYDRNHASETSLFQRPGIYSLKEPDNIALLPHEEQARKRQERLQQLQRIVGAEEIHDRYDVWMDELFELQNPHVDFRSSEGQGLKTAFVADRNTVIDGVWVHYPWKKQLVHLPRDDEFRKVYFSRHFPLHSEEDQHLLQNMHVAIGGQSVGRGIGIEAIVAGVGEISIFDPDSISGSNLARMKARVDEVGESKVLSAARELYELNPYIRVKPYAEGLTEINIKHALQNCHAFVDAMDGLMMKSMARDVARASGIPVVMGSDTSTSPSVRVELPEDMKFGGMNQEAYDILTNSPRNKFEGIHLVVDILGLHNLTGDMLDAFQSFAEGRLKYWPQLPYTCSVVAGKVTSNLVEIARGNAEKLPKFEIIDIKERGIALQEDDKSKQAAFAIYLNEKIEKARDERKAA